MSRDSRIRMLLAVLFAAGLVLLATVTEWVEVDVEKPARGEAAKNRLYAVQALLRNLGATVVKRQNLETMPPPQAGLVLVSRHWDLFPERARQLRQWVEQGGRLVLPGTMVDHKLLRDWLPVAELKKERASSTAEPPRPDRAAPDRDCRALSEPETVTASFAEGRAFRICAPMHWMNFAAKAGGEAQWALQGQTGTEMIRVAAGRGSVTVVGPWRMVENGNVLRVDNPLAVAAAFRAGPGTQVWFVDEEAREPFVSWVWQQAWPAVVLVLAALALFVWRGALRFGPPAAVADRHRRSMTEQVGGTGHFLQRHGDGALQRAQVRALHDTAARHIRNYARLDVFRRAQALADATGADRQAIAHALREMPRKPGELAADLEVLETVRRRLGGAAQPLAEANPSLS
ncbi:MAG: DUF4350 domain-containing protein [Ramlibacter sp.]